MPRDIASLLGEAELGVKPQSLPYPGLMKELARQALEREPLYDYRGRSARGVRERITQVRKTVPRCLGISPRELPARPTRVRERKPVQFDGFSITPVVIERGAGWHITAHLYLPDGLAQPAPAVMHVHGHSYQGKSADFYARRCRGLARSGFAVLFIDFPEADERKGTGHALWYPVLANLTLQGIMALDNSAALTYLSSLPMVDEKRIGVTGSSGGGNQTAYFSAVDARVAAAAPTNAPCMIAEHANSGSGAYCHCEAIPGLVAAGIEYHDLLAAIAPRPLRVFAGIRDPLFPIIGARRAVKEAGFAYRALGAGDLCTLEEHYCDHACPPAMRDGTYRFFRKALKRPGDIAGPGDEGDDIDLADPRLRALPKRPAKFLTVSDLYRARLRSVHPKPLASAQLNRLLGRTTGDARTSCLVHLPAPQWTRVLLRTADGAVLPLVIKGKGKGRLVLAISDKGKKDALARSASSRRIASFDWRGQGETAPPQDEWYQRASHYLAFGGETVAGGRVTDLIAVVKWLQQQGEEIDRIVAFGGEAGLIAMLAACVDTKLPNVQLHGMLRTFKDAPGMAGQVKYTAWVPGLAAKTDIPHLLKSLRARAVVRSWLKPGPERAREGYT